MPTPALVVLTDFFAVSNRALSYAAGLALPLQAHLVLLHVRHDGLLSLDSYARHHEGPLDERHTKQALHKLAKNQPVPAQVEVSDEFLPDAVAEAVHHHHPELLVLGRPGTSTTPEEVVTSAALDLLRRVPYPLLIVPTVGWDSFPPRRLALAIDGEPFTLYENQYIVQHLLASTKGTLHIIHVANKLEQDHDPEQLVRMVRGAGLGDTLTREQVVVVPGLRPAQGIQQAAGELNADMLIVVARRHNLLSSLFHRSVTAQLISESAIPVLLLPSQD
ncbi:Universal stress protein family protein [Hymenobacter gelipurpurascens]|uniref:Universal stress protein family protein n=1 Tax=Hymenobacter gelipurpurascens TaxID=89968 RepID=A0A212TPB7_9BACT|nr:universal stress protein [Hymenobacter gelipurpurascens]SNC67835.1 Universal stress protein family protein [Hymenobacter gelipurpurascens]